MIIHLLQLKKIMSMASYRISWRDLVTRTKLDAANIYRYAMGIKREGVFLIPSTYKLVFADSFVGDWHTKWDDASTWWSQPYHPGVMNQWYDPNQIKVIPEGVEFSAVVKPKEFEGVTYDKRTENENENENKNTIDTNYNNTVNTPEKSFLWTDQLKAFNNDFRWKEKFCRDKSIKMQVLENLMARYISDIELKEDFKQTKELKNHFTNWYNKNSKNGFTNSGNEQKLGTSEARTEALRNWGA